MISLEFCSRGDSRYKEIRDGHYVDSFGAHGQQIHFLVWDEDRLAGIISAGSAVYAVGARDEFFGIPKDRRLRERLYLSAIANNTVFRLLDREKHAVNGYPDPLGTQVLALWRKTAAQLWQELYSVPLIGFETFIVAESWRQGSMYKADNWTIVGETAGSAKHHRGGGQGLTHSHERLDTNKKLILCRWARKKVVPEVEYKSSWRAETEEEKARARAIARRRKELLGERFAK